MATECKQIGPATLYLGDCLEILPTLEPESVQAVLTDPVWPNVPAGMFPDIDDPQALLDKALYRLPAGVRQVVICLRNDSDPRFLQAVPKQYPFQQVAWCQYVMPGYLGRVLGGNECAYAFGAPVKKREGRNVIPSVSPKAQPGDRPPNGHPCSRALIHQEWLVKWFSDEWETVLDPFMGSATVGEACIRLGRRFIGIEVNPEYFAIAEERMKRALLDKASQLPLTFPPKMEQVELFG